MSKRVFITLLQTCMINGLPRSPAEGVQEVEKGDADRLIEANMAELADMSGEDDGSEGDDGLDKQTVPQLKKLATDERVVFAAGANKADLITAIRDGRDRADAREALAGFDRDRLLEIAKKDEVQIADDATDDQIREAIFDHTFPPAE